MVDETRKDPSEAKAKDESAVSSEWRTRRLSLSLKFVCGLRGQGRLMNLTS